MKETLIKLVIFIMGVGLLIMSCNDPNTRTFGACKDALYAGDYTEAIAQCKVATNRYELAAAYLGKAGFDTVNLLDSTATTIEAYSASATLGNDTISGATILNIMKLSPAHISDNTTRGQSIATARDNLESALDLLVPLSATADTAAGTKETVDEIFVELFAAAFAAQLESTLLFDLGFILGNSTNGTVINGSLQLLNGTTVVVDPFTGDNVTFIPSKGYMATLYNDGVNKNGTIKDNATGNFTVRLMVVDSLPALDNTTVPATFTTPTAKRISFFGNSSVSFFTSF